MCILFIAVEQHPKFPLIIAANRDEFHERPSSPSNFWQHSSDVLAGKDERAGGTWMGINKQGRVAALTNIRAPEKDKLDAQTRGELVLNYLQNQNISAKEYAKTLHSTREHYNGYNLLFGSLDKLFVYNNHDDTLDRLKAGVYGLSNANLNAPWPKVATGRDALAKYCKHADILDNEHLFQLLKNNSQADDQALPATGIPLEWERFLSSIFIQGSEYGTRASTILTVDKQQRVMWEERNFNTLGDITNTQHFEFSISKATVLNQ